MSVYVDSAMLPFGRMKCSHMIADDLDELHAMAKLIGMRREWFQPSSFPHYDVSKSRREKAITNGAIVLDRRGLAAKMKEIRTKAKEA